MLLLFLFHIQKIQYLFCEYTIKLLSTSFPNMTIAEVTQFVNGMFESTTDTPIFKNHIRDFLVQSKEFSAQVSKFCYQFYWTYFLTIEQEIFAVLTDTFHKLGFKLQVMVLQHLFCLIESGSLTEPLWVAAATVSFPYSNNTVFIRECNIKLLSPSFPNVTITVVTQFVKWAVGVNH